MEYLEMIISAILDCLEECIDTTTIVSGKKTIKVWYITVGFLLLAVVLTIIDIPCFISWEEALTAVLLMGIVTSINTVSRSQIEAFKEKLRK